MAEERNKTIKEAKKEIEYLTGDEEVKRLTELREKWEMDRISEVNEAKRQAIKEGKEEGRQEGIKEGRKEGREEGRKAGKEEGKKEEKLDIAKNMLKDNMDFVTISKYTGLSKEEIEKIKENN